MPENRANLQRETQNQFATALYYLTAMTVQSSQTEQPNIFNTIPRQEHHLNNKILYPQTFYSIVYKVKAMSRSTM